MPNNFPPDHVDDLWEKIPSQLQEGLHAYMMEHREVGGFLTAVLENDLFVAIARADPVARRHFYDLCLYIYNCAPGQCFGSTEKVDAWLRKF
jgi:hypothetical protein